MDVLPRKTNGEEGGRDRDNFPLGQHCLSHNHTEGNSVSEFIDAATSRTDAARRLKLHAQVLIKQRLPVIQVECTLLYEMETRTNL